MVAMRREIERLLKQADRDLQNARKNLAIEAFEVPRFSLSKPSKVYLPSYGAISQI